MDGAALGDWLLGDSEGAMLGNREGAAEGARVVGEPEGADVVGPEEGRLEGAADGVAVG